MQVRGDLISKIGWVLLCSLLTLKGGEQMSNEQSDPMPLL